jgi:hypothetical protein
MKSLAPKWRIASNSEEVPNAGRLVSVDSSIDAIAQQALEEARRMEEDERLRSRLGTILPPK